MGNREVVGMMAQYGARLKGSAILYFEGIENSKKWEKKGDLIS